MDDLRPELRDEFARQQEELGDLAGTREHLLQRSFEARAARGGGGAQLAAGIAALLLTAVVVGTFAYIRANGRPQGALPPVASASPMALRPTPTPADSPSPDESPSPSPSPEVSPTPTPSPAPSPEPSPVPTTSPVAGNAPQNRMWGSMAYDAERHMAVLFGGAGPSGFMNDTWTWDGTAWTQVTPATSPSRREMAGMVWEANQKRVLLFGGIGPTGSPLNDTWAWDGTAWTRLHPAHSPSARAPLATAYDESGARVLLYGGRQVGNTTSAGDTWIWNGSDWTMQATQSPDANVVTYPSIGLAWDPATREVTLVDWNPAWTCSACNGGGIRVWRLGASGWSAPVYYQCGCDGNDNLMAFDPGRDRWLFYGSQSAVYNWGVTIFDGVNRTSPGEVTPHPGAAGDDMAFAYDPDNKVILVFGGRNAGVPTAELWSWDFQRWSRLAG